MLRRLLAVRIPKLFLVHGQSDVVELAPAHLGYALYIPLGEESEPFVSASLTLTEPMRDVRPTFDRKCHHSFLSVFEG